MKQEASKKSKLWIWIVAVIALLLAAGAAVAGFLIFGGEQPGEQQGEEGPTGGRPAIYFNVDREDYLEAETGLSARTPGEDGNYYIRFAHDGELKDLLIADKQLVNFIDTMDVMGLVMDADGTVIDAVDIREVATEIARDFYIQAVNGDVLTLNSSLALNGMEMKITMGELGRVFSLTEKAEFLGQELELSEVLPMDSVTVYGNDLGEVTHVMVTAHPIESPIYWRANQYYNSKTKETTRVPDANGVYSMDFFVNGERVTLKCKNKALVSALDQPNKFVCHKGLVFDEDGYIVDRVTAASGIRGMLACELFETIQVDGNTFTAERKIAGSNEVGKQYTATIPEDCPIYDVSFYEEEENRGKRIDSLKVGDRLCVFTDTAGKPVTVFVTHRLCDSPLYVNVTKMVSNGQTTRKPDANGWYYIDLVVNYELKTFRSKDKTLISKIDALSSRGVGLELDGDVITRVWGHEHVYGYGATVGYYIDSITSIVLTLSDINGNNTTTRIMNSECQVVNISGIGGEIGSKTTPQVGDYIIAINNPASEAMHIIVIQRAVDEPVYYNLLRKYDSANKVTTRVPVNGYYEFLMAKDGKQVTVKTTSKTIASKIDAQSPGYMALKVRGGIAYEVYPASSSTGGQPQGSGYYVKGWQEDGTLQVYSKTSGSTLNLKMAKDYKIYNVSPIFNDFKGEKISNVKADDMIAALRNRKGEVVILYVRSRAYDVKACWHVKRMYDSKTASTTRVPDADGYYNYEIVQDGKLIKVKTKDKLVADDLDFRNAQFGIYANNGIVKGVFGPLDVKNAAAAGEVNAAKFVKLSGNKLTVLKGGEEVTVTLRSDCKIYDISSSSNFGKVTTLKEGDTIGRSYKDKDGKHSYLYISSRYYPRVEGQTGYCEHCKQEVTWEVWSGKAFPAQDGHYYVGTDMRELAAVTMGHATIDTDIVLDLNGKTAAFADSRAFLVYRGATLSIIDSVGGGKITSRGYADNEGVIRVANTDQRPGKLNLYGGTLELAKQDSGAVTPLWRGGVVYLNGTNTEFNMYGGTVTGGQVADKLEGKANPHAGGNIYNNNGKLNIYGGTITGGKAASGIGHNIYSAGGQVLIAGGKLQGGITMNGSATVTLSGAPEITKDNGGLVLEPGATVKLDQIAAGTVIPVDATGTFMSGLANPEAVKGYFESTKEGFDILISGDSLACGEGAYCDHCGQTVVWNEFKGTLGDGHFYMTADTRLSSPTVGKLLGDGSYGAMTAVLDLRGFKLLPTSDDQTVAQYRLMMVRGEADITVFDSSEAQTGMLVGRPNVQDAGAVIRLTDKAKFTLMSGTIALELLEGQEYHTYRGGVVMLNTANTVFNMLGGKITGGQVVSEEGKTNMGGGNVYLRGGTFNMQGGVIEGGNSNGLPGMNMYVSDEYASNVILQGGTIDGGIYVASGAKVTVGGDIKIANKDNGLDLTSGSLLSIDKIDTEAAEIYVKADGIFTNPSEFYADAAEVIKPVDEALRINRVPSKKLLHYGEKYIDLGSVTNENLSFVENTQTAYCEHCGEEVEWVALEKITAETTLEDGKHYYLQGDLENSAVYKSPAGSSSARASVVIHLNGNNLTSSQRVLYVSAYSDVTILGNGTVSGASALAGNLTTGKAATIYLRGNLNLLGGTYTKDATSPYPVMAMGRPNDAVKIYKGATVVLPEGATSAAIQIGAGKLTIEGATINGTVDMAGNDMNNTLYQRHMILNDATINGKVLVTKQANATIEGLHYEFLVTGATKVTEMVIEQGGKVDFTQLAEGADITVVATGIFTGANELYAEYVKAELVKSGVADMIVNVTEAGEMEIAEPEYPITNADLVFEENSNKAFCEHCREVVEWTALEAITAPTELQDGKHYYLAENLENAAHYIMPGGMTAVVHMNGKNMTSSALALFVKRNSEMTILGNGTITGANTTFTANSLDGLHSATIHNRGKLYMHGVTVVAATTTELPVITQANPVGITEINESAVVIGNVDAPAAHLIVKGLLDGNVDFYNHINTTNYQHYLTVENGTIKGTVKAPLKFPDAGGDGTTYAFQLIGTVNVGEFELEAGKLLIVDRLAADSKVGIKAELDTAFTKASDNAQELVEAGVFTSSVENTMIAVKENALVVAEDATNKNLEFIDNTATAFCQHCQQNVEWVALEKITTETTLEDGKHYYLQGDLENSAVYKSPAGSSSARKSVVIHLNGNNLTSSQRVLYVSAYSDVTILGNGTVSGASALAGNLTTGKAATIYLRGNLNLLGGTYTKDATSPYPVMAMGRPNDAVKIYKGATVVLPEGATSAAIQIGAGKLTIEGATINGTVDMAGNDMNNTLYQRHMILNDATINGKVLVTKQANATIEGLHYEFLVTGATKVTEMVIEKGGKVDFVELAENADITVTATGTFTESARAEAADWLAAGLIKAGTTVDIAAIEGHLVATAKAAQ